MDITHVVHANKKDRRYFRNALFERPESFVTVSETANTLDIAAARRENIPEYVTIRRQRPTTEETTTVQYVNLYQLVYR